ncbi:MAG TPA: Trp biosynthesis-associated membrane protein [Marmoricola sp.]|nr:Trp biosynthesis-associated membrane protein [Marmoricola sp.]
MARARNSFIPAVVLGFSGAGLITVAGSKPWVTLTGPAPASGPATDELLKQPLAGALGLLLLATWGVILVTGPVARWLAAGLGLVTSIGVVGTVIDGYQIAERVSAELGTQDAVRSNWLWVALLGAVLALAAGALAIRFAPGWPRMSSRYDSPTAATGQADSGTSLPGDPAAGDRQRELWDQINQGNDPTAHEPNQSDRLD